MVTFVLMNKKGHLNKNKPEMLRPVEAFFGTLNTVFQQESKSFYAFFLALTFFGIMGLIWMIPFPQFQFLVDLNMHTFLNWGSLFIAIVVYAYLKLAPTLSYAALFCISIMSFFIVQLEYIERDGGLSVVLVCSILALFGLVGLFLLSKKESNCQPKDFMLLLSVGPIWLWSKVYDQFKIKY